MNHSEEISFCKSCQLTFTFEQDFALHSCLEIKEESSNSNIDSKFQSEIKSVPQNKKMRKRCIKQKLNIHELCTNLHLLIFEVKRAHFGLQNPHIWVI